MRPSHPTRPAVACAAALLPLILLAFATAEFHAVYASQSVSLPAHTKAVEKFVSKPPSALTLYRQKLTADSRYAYTGRRFSTSWRDDDRIVASASWVSHLPPFKEVILFTAPRSRHGSVILTSGDEQWTYVPQRGVVVHSTLQPDISPPQQTAQFNLLLANFALKVQPTPSTVAGRKVFSVALVPRSLGRPFEKLWIDPYTGLVLRYEVYHADGSMAAVTYFSEIHINPKLDPKSFTPERWAALKPRVIERRTTPPTIVDTTKLLPPFANSAAVPRVLDGFVLQKAFLEKSALVGGAGGGINSLHLVYYDGLNSLSLVETPRRAKAPTHLPGSRAVSIQTGLTGRIAQQYSVSILSWDTPSMNYALVADLGATSLARIARLVNASKR